MKTLGLILAALTLLASCGKNDNPTSPVSSCPTGQVCSTSLTMDAANDFYKRFQYQVIGDCKTDKTKVRFSWLSLADRVVIGKTTDGNDIVAEINLYLDDKGGYTGEYQENTQAFDDGFYETIDSKNKRDLSGRWSLADGGLDKDKKPIVNVTLDNVGTGTNVTAHNWDAIQISQVKTDLNASLTNQTLTFIKNRSMITKDGQTVDQYCAGVK